jgi:hypothetical protein
MIYLVTMPPKVNGRSIIYRIKAKNAASANVQATYIHNTPLTVADAQALGMKSWTISND